MTKLRGEPAVNCAAGATEYRRPAVPEASNVARVHVRAFPNFFLTSLGERFLRSFYRSILESPSGIAVAAYTPDAELVGFAVGSFPSAGFYGGLVRRRWIRMLGAALPSLIASPRGVYRILTNLLSSEGHSGDATAACLLSICVLPKYRRSGCGDQLNHLFEDDARRRGATEVFLTTDTDGNDSVNRFYLRRGYLIRKQYQNRVGRQLNLFFKPI